MEEFDFYPQKPQLIESESRSTLKSTLISMFFFIAAFLLLFSDQLIIIGFLVIALVIHELGHFWTMKKFNYRNVRMLFVPLMGAFVNGKKERYSQKESFWVVMAGPFPGIIIGGLLIYLSPMYDSSLMFILGGIFLFLNVMNLLPLDPLDGGQMLKLLLKKRHEFFMLIFAFVSSIVMIGIGWYFQFYILMIFGFIMGIRVRSMQKNYQMHTELDDEEINYTTTYKELSNRDFSKIKDVLMSHTPALQKYADFAEPHELDELLANQVNNVLITPTQFDAKLIFKIVVVASWIAAFALPFILFYWIDTDWLISALQNEF